jgi:serine/threonine protein kinase/Flp pilus assembly protein TadD
MNASDAKDLEKGDAECHGCSSRSPQPVAPDDSRVRRVLHEYLAALDAGDNPDRDAFLARHPEIAPVLADCLDALEFVRSAASPLQSSAPAGEPGLSAPEGAIPAPLGDFRIVREVGRGGMGVVYEAEQMSLGRRVALKVLPFAATMDPRQLQRFQNEARAAASLEHPHIVPVYGVGCERGVHYYAMKFIDGQSLAEVIGELNKAKETNHRGTETTEKNQNTVASSLCSLCLCGPNDFFKSVAELGIQAAEALEHAHSVGIVHRDIKPANLLIDDSLLPTPNSLLPTPYSPRLWITDFGLAQVQSDTRLTMTGDLVGTLRYMSPEQALAKRVVVDHRTDVYSLGVTLYELLTLEPAFTGEDRQELLRQIAFEEPRPPRRINKAIPAELETIVLKAMEKNPAERYATAQELGDDLRRFLNHETIRARRASFMQRARKWARRNKTLVRAVAAFVLVLVLLGGVAEWREYRQRMAAMRTVEAGLERADLLQQQERWDEALAVLAVAEGELTDRKWSALRERLGDRKRDVEMVSRLEKARLQSAAGSKDMGFDYAGSDRLYASAFEWYGLDKVALGVPEATERVRQSAVRVYLTAALDDWATVKDKLTHEGGAPLRAIADLADDDPWRRTLREAFKRKDWGALEKLAEEQGTSTQSPTNLVLLVGGLEGANNWRAAERLLRRAQQASPGDFWINFHLGAALYFKKPSDPGESARYYQAALALRPQSPVVYNNLGDVLHARKKLAEAIAAYEQAIALQPDLASVYSNLGHALQEQGRYEEAVAACRKATELAPDSATAHYNLGCVLSDQEKFAEAVTAYSKAIDLQKDFPDVHNNLGHALHRLGKLVEAEEALWKAVKFQPDNPRAYNNLGIALGLQGKLAEAAEQFEKAIEHKSDYAEYHYNLGKALQDQAKLVDAKAAYEKAVAIQPDYAEAHHNLGILFQIQGRLPEAVEAHRKAIKAKPEFASSHYNLGNALFALGKLEEAERAFRQALAHQPDYAEAHCDLGQLLVRQGRFAEGLAARKKGHKKGSKQPGWRYPSADWVRQAERLVEIETKLPKILRRELQPTDVGECLALAQMCQEYKGLYLSAFRFYRDAFAEQPQLADDLQQQHRYNAARAAARAGWGQSDDAEKIDDKECARLRQQALNWLEADLAAYRQALDKEPDKARPAVMQRMQHWQEDKDFAGVRGDALSKLPEAERRHWQQMWNAVGALLKSTSEPAKKAGS